MLSQRFQDALSFAFRRSLGFERRRELRHSLFGGKVCLGFLRRMHCCSIFCAAMTLSAGGRLLPWLHGCLAGIHGRPARNAWACGAEGGVCCLDC